MYICICHSVSDRQIEDAVERGHVSSLSCLRRCFGVGTGCGICLHDAKKCLSDALSKCPLQETIGKFGVAQKIGNGYRQQQDSFKL